MNTTTENYIGHEELVTYLNESRNLSYCRFLSLNHDTIIASISSLTMTKWQSIDIT